MSTMTKWTVSVRDLVEFVWRSGDMKSLGEGPTMQMGAEGHRWLQSIRPTDYISEVSLTKTVEQNGIALVISGRADGVYTKQEPTVLEEIKTTVESPLLITIDANPTHMAQAMIYGAMYCEQNNQDELVIQLTYLVITDQQTRSFRQRVNRKTLNVFFDQTVSSYFEWVEMVLDWRKERDKTLKEITFPHPSWRKGQKDLSERVKRTIVSRSGLFAEAPTGSGKTLGVLYGALQGMGEQPFSQILFLTAKTVGRVTVGSELQRLFEHGIPLKVLPLISRTASCIHPTSECSSDSCPLAEGHFDRLREGAKALFDSTSIDQAQIEITAKKHSLCPYWLAREVAPYVDIVVCDYNYVFDPHAAFSGFRQSKNGASILLVDEAHNLVERAREMFSSQIKRSTFAQLERKLDSSFRQLRQATRHVTKAIVAVAEERRMLGMDDPILENLPEYLNASIVNFCDVTAESLVHNSNHPVSPLLRDIYFNVLAFLRAVTNKTEDDTLFVEVGSREVIIKSLCVDPSSRIKQIRKELAAASVFFSATLSPITYFKQMLGAEEHDSVRRWPPIFPAEHCFSAVMNRVSTLFRDREKTAETVSQSILAVVLAKKGNYLSFFPSYDYLSLIQKKLREIAPASLKIIEQNRGASEREKKRFLAHFESSHKGALLGLAVLGGIYGEAIDLTGERLIGAIIVSPGLPKITLERELIRRHFENLAGAGFDFAYRYPGLNKVIQAAGRVIRDQDDRGTIVFIGKRFAAPFYTEHLADRWTSLESLNSSNILKRKLEIFWTPTE